MTNFTLKGLLYGRFEPEKRIPLSQSGMTTDIQCDSCGKIFKRWSILARSSTTCDECLAKAPTAH
ncbi:MULTISPECIES: hypothetical protein [Rhizobium]|jgi:hypothetical protein|uniref:Uncharacterized protein n=1 Tax=Rhizobium altiplani TaxID=1864509 RepID=A0A109JCY4_9HYPH|nr:MULTISPECIES: hypothetical protein [Rhizobium]KWV46602.1 hypothetical protein AS026_14425 [Rhizobium altiplani]MBD9446094.1 hypothetical protein [Rhizobium sp. RHZ01]MBD9452874.1 hypothetical protein [Rhizobium sp. RHZ02]MBZ9788595.1 hypothetical protein [Rhizobium sp. 3T7]NMN70654.1 hypothetical protein [Rhizobium sp. 57MFTsu3.2]